MMMIIIIIITLFKSQWIKLSTAALQVEETTNQTESPSNESQTNQIKMLVFGERENWSTVPWKIYLEHRRELANSTSVWCQEQDFNESRDGVVVRALAFHHCRMDLISWPASISGLSIGVLYPVLRGFSPGTPLTKNQHLISFDCAHETSPLKLE